MNKVVAFIESGILELFAMGIATEEEILEVEKMAESYEEVRSEIEKISLTLENYATAHSAQPSQTVKPILLATIDYIERIQNGEEHVIPPVLTQNSSPANYAEWLNRSDMVAPDDFGDLFLKIIGYTPAATTGIVWISRMPDEETHDDEHEKFLIIEGTCDLVVSGVVNKLAPGDFFQVPLHEPHKFLVTSDIPCKAILQRQVVAYC